MFMKKKSSFALSEMFSVELKFTIDGLLKSFSNICKSSFIELDILKNQKCEKTSSVNWSETKCIICSFKLSVGSSFGPNSEEMTIYDFVVKKEHLFLRNILRYFNFEPSFKLR